jgi:alpha-mannosidase
MDEKISFDIRRTKISRRIEEINRWKKGNTENFLPMQFKETPREIPSSAAVPPGDWTVIENSPLPYIYENSAAWLRRRFNLTEFDKKHNKWIWTLDLWFTNNFDGSEGSTIEGVVWINGNVRQGIDHYHRTVHLDDLKNDQDHEITIRLDLKPGHNNRLIRECNLQSLHKPSFHLYNKLRCILDIANILDPDSPSTLKLLDILDETINKIPFTEPGSDKYYEAIEKAEEEFLYPKSWDKISATVRSFGHAHIDVVWLWTMLDTRRKAVHTFSTVCNLLEEYPDFVFFQSQPVLYEFVKELEPELFEKIKKYIGEDRWIPEGCMWVESDCNMPSGESLIRQILCGKKFFKEQFNKETHIAWLPDTFGFNANLPQILKKSGVEYFSTSKISWSKYTRFPYDAFLWKGIDGSSVLSLFLSVYHSEGSTAATYNAHLTPDELKHTWKSFAQKDVQDETILSYGFGDGGGGPTREMLERIPILKDSPGLPKFVSGSPLETFRKMELIKEDLPVWKGELYLEYHRGALTSRGKIKYLHRKAESCLSLLEKVISTDMILHRRKISDEEKEKLDDLWKTLLTHQFHDIAAGTCIHEANVEIEEKLNEVVLASKELIFCIIDKWIGDRKEPVKKDEPVERNPLIINDDTVENDFYRVKINKRGQIVSCIDKRSEINEDLIVQGKAANILRFYEDRPLNWDAWDIDEFYIESPLEEPEVVDSSWTDITDIEAVFRINSKFRDSLISQKIIFRADTARIDFRTKIDWHNKNILIKSDFPLNLNTDEAYYEIPFGYIKRPTHKNHISDRAKFEVPALRWAAMFESGRGAAVLNDCKYGYSAYDNNLSITLLKSAVYPDPDAEEGVHECTYSFLPCNGSQPSGEIIREAYQLNLPMQIENQLKPHFVFETENVGNHIIIETIKPSEDGSGIVLRLYEALNRRGTASVKIPDFITKAQLVNLIEEEEKEIPILEGQRGHSISLKFTPFEIKTVKLRY